MKKKLSFVFAVIMIFTCLFAGCGTKYTNQVGSVSVFDDAPEGTVAVLTSAKGNEYFSTFSEPWGRANDEAYSSSNCTLTLLKDWIAVDGSLGDGYFFQDGALQPRERKDEDTWLIVDLNGYTIDRGLYNPDKGVDTPRKNGCIFYICSGSDDVNIKIMNGTLTGGNNTENGGAICNDDSDPDNIELINLKIKYNRSSGKGGGVCLNGAATRIIDTKITNNKSDNSGGGVYYGYNKLTLEGNVEIRYNDGWEDQDNLSICTNRIVDASKVSLSTSNMSIGFTKKTHYDSDYEVFYLGSNAEKLKNVFSCNNGRGTYIKNNSLWFNK